MNSNSIMIKIDRMSAWILFAIIIAYAITGYGMTKNFISHELSEELHLAWLGGIGLLAFVIHTSWAIHLSLVRHNIWNKATKILLPLFYLLLIGFFVWLHFFFSPANSSSSTTSKANTVYTAETLVKYNGKNGQPAYVAIDGIVYDASKEFRNGEHHGHTAGQDLSDEFHKEHPDSYLDGLTVVGSYQE